MNRFSKLISVLSAALVVGFAVSCAEPEPISDTTNGEEHAHAEGPAAGTTEITEVESIPREEIGLARYFHDPNLESLIRNGGFEQFRSGDRFPLGWEELLNAPQCSPEREIVRFGSQSLKLVGAQAEGQAGLRPSTYPPRSELNGNTVTWGAWIHTDQPDQVMLQIIEDWDHYNTARPTAENEWELVTVSQEITADMGSLNFTININPGAECYVDQAALVIGSLDDDDA